MDLKFASVAHQIDRKSTGTSKHRKNKSDLKNTSGSKIHQKPLTSMYKFKKDFFKNEIGYDNKENQSINVGETAPIN